MSRLTVLKFVALFAVAGMAAQSALAEPQTAEPGTTATQGTSAPVRVLVLAEDACPTCENR